MRVLITGGAGFVGSSLAVCFKEADPSVEVVAFDNLKRRGSELNLARFKRQGIHFVHGDVRQPGDFDDVSGTFDVIVDAAAEPSVHAGTTGSPGYLLGTNLDGTLHCLELARRRGSAFIFLSTSRVYSIAPLRAIALVEGAERFEIAENQVELGVGPAGIAETFPTHLPRSLYGASKLASELFVQEYASTYGLRAVINRCGVIAGPGQFGKVDQGVFTLWVANHLFGKPLRYTGFGGHGKQVRDLLHPADLFSLLQRQLAGGMAETEVFNVGGGREISVSLREMTTLCREATGRDVPIEEEAATSPVDVPLYISDYAKVRNRFGWEPLRTPEEIVKEILGWLRAGGPELESLFN